MLQAAEWFGPLGGQVEGLMVVDRASAEDPGMAAVVAGARFIYLSGGSPLHARAVLKKSAVFEALRAGPRRRGGRRRCRGGGHGAHRPDGRPRGGALTLGLGLVDNLTVVPHFGDEHDDAHGQKLERTVAMAPAALPVVALPVRTALDQRRRRHVALRGGRDAGRLRRRRPDRRARGTQGLSREIVQSFSSMVMLSMTTRSVGVPERLPTPSIAVTTSSPLTTSPKSE